MLRTSFTGMSCDGPMLLVPLLTWDLFCSLNKELYKTSGMLIIRRIKEDE